MHPQSFAASLLLILIFKNTSQIMRAKIPTEQKTMFWRSQPSPFSQFPFTLNSKALNLSLQSLTSQRKGRQTIEVLSLNGNSGLPALLLVSALGGLV